MGIPNLLSVMCRFEELFSCATLALFILGDQEQLPVSFDPFCPIRGRSSAPPIAELPFPIHTSFSLRLLFLSVFCFFFS